MFAIARRDEPPDTVRAASPALASRALDAELGDLRFRMLLAAADWEALPAPVRRRFSKRIENGASIVYRGEVTKMRMNAAGRLLAQLLRLVGAPLPICRDVGVPSVVIVTEDVTSSGQIWTRLYARKSGFPQVIQSAKRFCGPTGLEEHIGCGISMALAVSVDDKALAFRSAAYLWRFGPWQFRLPRLLHPGALIVMHEETIPGEFRFSLSLVHPLFGELLHQAGLYRDERI